MKASPIAAVSAQAAETTCFHCGLPLPPEANYAVEIEGVKRPMCCRGCEAVAQAIVDNGLADYYRFRTETAPNSQAVVPDFLRQIPIYDHPEVQKSFVRLTGAHVREASLILEGITCAACVWLNERHLARQKGVVSVSINYATHRAQVAWDERETGLSAILRAIADIGYRAHPYDPAQAQVLLERERKGYLRRLAVAGALGMQIMIFAVALYAGAFTGIEAEYRNLFNWLSLALTTPVLFYSAQPFFKAAWRDLRHRQAGMDIPVSLGMSIAFGASALATVTGRGEVYFDSVVMFTFFLLAGRYFELAARKQSVEASERLVQATPALATRLAAQGNDWREEQVVPAELAPGDRVLVRPGETVPADGRIVAGRSSVDESLLSGESRPLPVQPGERVIGGSINVESPLQMVVEASGQNTVLSSILRLLERAQTEKPRIARLADRAASRLVLFVLILTTLVAIYWYGAGSPHWLPIAISMLVVTCPCALSLATPTALTATTGSLMRRGVLVTRGHALEALTRATHFVFDKTGTLTLGRPRLIKVETWGGHDADASLRLAASLERQSEHPIARALIEATPATPLPVAEIENVPGAGLAGRVSGRSLFIGTPSFIAERTGIAPDARVRALEETGNTVVLLADAQALIAAFIIGDALRDGAADLVAELRRLGKRVILMTGDQEHAAHRIAQATGIEEYAAGLKPAEKLARIQALQRDGAVVAMAGDGVNDAAALAAAHVSIAIGSGTQLAAASADLILMASELSHLIWSLRAARRTMHIIRQNIARSIVYNAIALPAAALGYVAPWLAALGMSLSSSIVVANALRLVERPRRPS